MSREPHTGPVSLAVSVVTETYPPEINGVANTMRHLAEGLIALGHRVHLVRPRQQGERTLGPRDLQGARAGDTWPPEAGENWREGPAAPMGVTLVPGLPIPGYRGLRFGLPVYWRLRGLWRRLAPDAVYIATQGPLGHAALAAARGLGVPALTGFHTQFHQYSRHYGLGILTEPIAATLRQFHNRSDATLVPTRELQAELTAAGFRNVHVFGRGVDVRLFSPARRDPALRAAWGCGPDDLAVLYVGRIAAEKNLDLARETFEAIEAAHPRARFVLVGDGPSRFPLARDYPRFVCAGPRVGEDLARHYASGDLFLFPSLTETFGNVVPEAMASGLPVVAFDYAAARSYIVSGENGLSVPPRDAAGFVAAALAAARDRAGLRRMGESARRTAEGLSWERVLKGVEDRLFAVVRRARGPEGRHEAVAATTE